MIQEGEGSPEQKKRLHDMLGTVLQFCENRSDCRRVQILRYFSEQFRQEDCHNTCDNCQSRQSGQKFETKDLTQYAQTAIKLIGQLGENAKVTLLQCVDAFRGAKNSKRLAVFEKLKGFGYGADLAREDVQRLFEALVDYKALSYEPVVNKAGFSTNYVKLGDRCNDYLNGRTRLNMEVRITPTKPIIGRNEFPSTNISSPIQARARPRKRIQQYAYGAEDNDSEDAFDPVHASNSDEDDDGFAPVREGRRSAVQKKQLGPPITADEQLSHLTEAQRDLVEDFVNNAKDMCKKIQIQKSLRCQPFSDATLREIGLRLPTDEEALLQIPKINPEMVTYYGQKVLRLVKNVIEIHGPVPLTKPPEVSKRVRKASKKKNAEVPEDPNHRVVVNLVSSESEESEAEKSESSYGSPVELEDDVPGQTSRFFADQADEDTDQRRVDEYNRHQSQLDQMRSTATPAPATTNYGARGGGKSYGKGSSFGGGGRSRGGKVYSSGGNGGGGGRKRSSSGGVAKKTTTRKPRKGSGKFGGAGRGSGSGNRRGGGGASGGGAASTSASTSWGGIMAMPT
jgi:bloom syndrome protein